MPDGTTSAGGWTARAWRLFAATSALHFLSGNEADNDLWVHLLIGRRILDSGAIPRTDDLSFTAAGAPWVDHEWLAQVAMFSVFDGFGATLLWLLKLAAGLTTAYLVWSSIRRRNGILAIDAFTLVLALAAMARGFATRPQVFSYLFVAALLWLLDRQRGEPLRAGIAIPLAAVWMCAWANLHGAFIVGLGILGLWAISPPWRDLPTRLALPAVGLLAACVNPYGPWLFTYIWGELSMPHPLTEWQPVRFGDPAQWPSWIALIAVTATAPLARVLRESPWRLALVVITAYLALRHQRHVPLFALCVATPLADQLNHLAERFSLHLSDGAVRIVAAATVVMALLQLALFTTRVTGDRATLVFEADDYPVNAVRYASLNDLRGDMALPLDWGGYALWHLSPEIKVSMDGRFATVYPPDVVARNFDFFAGAGTELVTRHEPDFILAWSNVALPDQLAATYSLAFRDDVATLYARQRPSSRGMATAPPGRLPFP